MTTAFPQFPHDEQPDLKAEHDRDEAEFLELCRRRRIEPWRARALRNATEEQTNREETDE